MPQSKIHATITLIGRPPGLVLHSSELSDETNEFTVQINELIDKGRGRNKLTEDQRARKDLLQWRGALGGQYTDGKRIFVPATNLLRAIVTAARELNLGTKIEERGAVTLESDRLHIALESDDPAKGLEYGQIMDLYKNDRYRLRIPVNPNPTARNKVLLPVMRPVFPVWSSEITALVLPEMIDWDKFTKIMDMAGNVGIGNARKITYGRFDVRVEK